MENREIGVVPFDTTSLKFSGTLPSFRASVCAARVGLTKPAEVSTQGHGHREDVCQRGDMRRFRGTLSTLSVKHASAVLMEHPGPFSSPAVTTAEFAKKSIDLIMRFTDYN